MHPDFPADEGDVKYHQGASAIRRTESGREVEISVPSNPSHLEAVDPIVEGMVRAKQDRTGLPREESWARSLPVLLHGDAAFAGQGMVAEVFNLSQLRGYRTGGTIHLVVNNQIGFTTDPAAGRSSLYSTDVAKIVQVPIFHVNGDDPEAAYRVLQIALDYRQEFHKDVVIDLIGFRLHGHNEGDEPTYTQPLMYKRIQEHPGVRTLYARRLIKEGVLTQADVDALEKQQHDSYEAALEAAKDAGARAGAPAAPSRPTRDGSGGAVATGVSRDTLVRIGQGMTTVPARLQSQSQDGSAARPPRQDDGRVAAARLGDRGGLAFGSLLLEKFAIRLSGQDSARGTFSQRHVEFHDTKTGETWTPLARSRPIRGRSTSTTVPSRRRGFLDSSTDTASSIRRLWCCGRRSTAISPTAPRSSSISSSRRPRTSGGRLRVWVCCCHTGRKGKVPSIRARGSSDTCSSAPKTTCASAT